MPLVHDKRAEPAAAQIPVEASKAAPGARARVGRDASFEEGAARLRPDAEAPVQRTPALHLPANNGGAPSGDVEAPNPMAGAGKVVEASDKQSALSAPQRMALGLAVRSLASTLGAKPGGKPGGQLGGDVEMGVTPGAALVEWAKIIEKGTPDDQMMAWFLALVALGPGGVLPLVATPQQKADLLAQTAAGVTTFFAAQGGTPKPWQGFITRANAMRTFYLSISGGPDAGTMGEQKPVSGARQAMVGLALAQIGKVQAKLFGDKNDEGKSARTGWRALKMYLDGAGKPLNKGWERPSGTIPAWCGIFATWAARSAGMSIGPWPDAASASRLRGPHEVPQPGDIVNQQGEKVIVNGVESDANHFGVITWVQTPPANATPAQIKALSIRTVEGNTNTFGEVAQHESTVAKWTFGIRNVEKDVDPKKSGFSGE